MVSSDKEILISELSRPYGENSTVVGRGRQWEFLGLMLATHVPHPPEQFFARGREHLHAATPQHFRLNVLRRLGGIPM